MHTDLDPVQPDLVLLRRSSIPPQRKDFELDDFEVVGKSLGFGAIGSVSRVVQKGTGKFFAMKVMSKTKVLEFKLLANVEREIAAQQRIRHPNILQLYKCFETQDSIHLLLEYAPNGSLFDLLRDHRREAAATGQERLGLPESLAAGMFRSVAEALHFLHCNAFMHRDLKPENILVCEGGELKLADFGWCNMLEGACRQTFCGTMEYVSPEMLASEPHDCMVDVWAAGVLLFEMLVGRSPFAAGGHAQMIAKIMKVAYEFPHHVSASARDLAGRLLVKEPSRRLDLGKAVEHPWVRGHTSERDKAAQNSSGRPSIQTFSGEPSDSCHSLHGVPLQTCPSEATLEFHTGLSAQSAAPPGSGWRLEEGPPGRAVAASAAEGPAAERVQATGSLEATPQAGAVTRQFRSQSQPVTGRHSKVAPQEGGRREPHGRAPPCGGWLVAEARTGTRMHAPDSPEGLAASTPNEPRDPLEAASDAQPAAASSGGAARPLEAGTPERDEPVRGRSRPIIQTPSSEPSETCYSPHEGSPQAQEAHAMLGRAVKTRSRTLRASASASTAGLEGHELAEARRLLEVENWRSEARRRLMNATQRRSQKDLFLALGEAGRLDFSKDRTLIEHAREVLASLSGDAEDGPTRGPPELDLGCSAVDSAEPMQLAPRRGLLAFGASPRSECRSSISSSGVSSQACPSPVGVGLRERLAMQKRRGGESEAHELCSLTSRSTVSSVYAGDPVRSTATHLPRWSAPSPHGGAVGPREASDPFAPPDVSEEGAAVSLRPARSWTSPSPACPRGPSPRSPAGPGQPRRAPSEEEGGGLEPGLGSQRDRPSCGGREECCVS